MTTIKEGILFGMGSPLLDISATTGEDFLKKYNMKANDQILGDEQHIPMYDDLVNNFPVDYIAGGSTLNTIRVAQCILKKNKSCVYTGCIGNDEFGKILQSKTEESGVDARFQIHETVPTGTCAVIITNKGLNRSLCAYLGASKQYSKNHLDQCENMKSVQDAQLFYIAGFFLTVSMESIMAIARHSAQFNKVFCMNLSAPYLSTFYKEEQDQVLPYIDILFGNEVETETFAKEHNLNMKSMKTMALDINALEKVNKLRPRITVITQGKNPVIVANGNEVMEFEVEYLPENEVVDTNGAGDAFTGGFLSQFVLGKPLEICVNCGIHASREVIKSSGCTFTSDFRFIS